MIASFYIDASGALVSLAGSRAKLVPMVDAFVWEQSNLLLRKMKAFAPKRTGLFAKGLRRYRRPATAVVGGVAKVDVVAGGPHGFVSKFLMHGTRPHRITSSRPMPMVYEGEAVSFAHSVSHPGMQRSDFVERAADDVRRTLPLAARKSLRMLPMLR